MDKYELIVILDAADSAEKKETAMRHVGEALNKLGGRIVNSQIWLEKQKFTFPIKKRTEGTYYLVNFEAERNRLKDIRDALKLNEALLRTLILRAEE